MKKAEKIKLNNQKVGNFSPPHRLPKDNEAGNGFLKMKAAEKKDECERECLEIFIKFAFPKTYQI